MGAVKLKEIIGYDDTLDAFGVHGLVGILGALMTGILANPAINEGTGLLYGNPAQFLIQLKVVGITIAYSAIGTFAVFKLCSLITNGARVTEIVEYNGLDSMIHGERGFDLNEEVLEQSIKNN